MTYSQFNGRVRRDASQWRALLDDFERAGHTVAGHTVAGFCRERGVSVASFYHWRRRLARTGCLTGQRADRPQVVRLEVQDGVADGAGEDGADAVVMAALPGGVRVTVPATHLRELVDALLERSSCSV